MLLPFEKTVEVRGVGPLKALFVEQATSATLLWYVNSSGLITWVRFIHDGESLVRLLADTYNQTEPAD